MLILLGIVRILKSVEGDKVTTALCLASGCRRVYLRARFTTLSATFRVELVTADVCAPVAQLDRAPAF
jgi:hypothetical protein